MKTVVRDLSRYQKFIALLERIAEHRRRNPTSAVDELYYELLAKYFRQALNAKEEGKLVVAHTVMTPQEIFYALDMVPLHLESLAVISVPVLRDSDEIFSLAKGFGLPPEICSAHRAQAAMFLQGSLPCDVVVCGHQICDSSYKSGELLRELYGVPGYVMDRAYRYDERDARYYAQELAEAISFLEGVGHRRLDPERLAQALNYSRQMMELHQEIYELRRAVPSPAVNRRGPQLMFIGWLFTGAPEGVAFFRAVRDELKEKVAQGQGAVAAEQFRLVAIFPPPAHKWKLLDWMEREHGAVTVADPYCSHWGDFAWDESQPLLTLARKWMASPLNRQMHGPAELGWVPDTVGDAQDHKAEGAIYWAHIGCKQGCALIRIIKDALMEQVGIPTLVLDVDVLDPSFVTEEELKDKLEGFFELLEARR